MLLADEGVIDALKPVSANDELAEVVFVESVTFTTCNTFPPPAGATHFNPVASAESAVKTVPFAPTPKRASTVVKVNKSPLVVNGV